MWLRRTLVILLLASCSGTEDTRREHSDVAPLGQPQKVELTATAAIESEVFEPVYAESPAELHQIGLDALADYDGNSIATDALIHYADAFEQNGASWGLTSDRRELVVLVDDAPHVHIDRSDPHAMAHVSNTRPLDSWEATAWTELLAGEDLVTAFSSLRMQMMGALRNRASCRECHVDEKPDALLGAWAYTFHEIADD